MCGKKEMKFQKCMKKKRGRLRKFAILVVALLPILIYCINFYKFSISDNPSDWALFGEYIGGIYSVIAALLVVYLTRYLSKEDNKRNKLIEIVESLYQQIKVIENNDYDYPSIAKLRGDINLNELYLPENIKNKLIKLADQFNEYKDNNGELDLEFKKSVMDSLKNIYEQ